MCAALHRREARTTAFRVQKRRENDGRCHNRVVKLVERLTHIRDTYLQAQTQNSVTSFYKFGP